LGSNATCPHGQLPRSRIILLPLSASTARSRATQSCLHPGLVTTGPRPPESLPSFRQAHQSPSWISPSSAIARGRDWPDSCRAAMHGARFLFVRPATAPAREAAASSGALLVLFAMLGAVPVAA